MNVINSPFEEETASLFSALGSPFRVRILLEIGEGEACVCHLESALKKRQAFISQHLMALREAGLLETRRDGKYIYYRLSRPDFLDLIHDASRLAGFDHAQVSKIETSTNVEICDCPLCRATISNAE
jgi:DNA-binding transcriptional ArsR family regulator